MLFFDASESISCKNVEIHVLFKLNKKVFIFMLNVNKCE